MALSKKDFDKAVEAAKDLYVKSETPIAEIVENKKGDENMTAALEDGQYQYLFNTDKKYNGRVYDAFVWVSKDTGETKVTSASASYRRPFDVDSASFTPSTNPTPEEGTLYTVEKHTGLFPVFVEGKFKVATPEEVADTKIITHEYRGQNIVFEERGYFTFEA